MFSKDLIKKSIWYCIIGIILLAFGWSAGCNHVRKTLSPRQEVRVDTVWRTKPTPLSTIVIGSVPHAYFFTETVYDETGYQTSVTKDSVVMDVPIVRRTYPDSLYYAIVSGPAVGDYLPSLDSIAIYSKTITTIVKGNPAPTSRWSFGPVAKTGYNGRFYALTGISAQYTKNRISVRATAGYDPLFGGFGGDLSASIDLFRIK